MAFRSLAIGKLLRLPARQTGDVVVDPGIAVPMRDGVELVGDRWQARGFETGPVVLMRSPYGRGSLFALTARLFAEGGFQVFVQSCRGTSGSPGLLDPMRQETNVGRVYAVLKLIAGLQLTASRAATGSVFW